MTNSNEIIHDNPLDGVDSLVQGLELLLAIEGPAALDPGLVLLVRTLHAQGLAISKNLMAQMNSQEKE